MIRKFCIALVLLLSIVLVSCNGAELKVIVVDVEKVFEEFQMQKEFRSEVDAYVNQNKGILDSLSAEVNKLADQIDLQPKPSQVEVDLYKRLYSISVREQQKYDTEVEEMISKYDQMILKRINTGIQEFAKKEAVDLVVSKGGSYPGVLYSTDLLDETEAFIIYLNDNYENLN